jgi:hypothetical protein
MGEARRKSDRRRRLLEDHPHCIYCGAPANTTDHCPPRAFFQSRHWPETYEFPACGPCNASARLDEQALAVLIRSTLSEVRPEADNLEWRKLVQGVKNNQPLLMAEWRNLTRNEVKRDLRKAFGREGDAMRARGWGTLNMGPLTQAMIQRFMIKLGKALYYRHNNQVFDGVMYTHHIDRFSRDTTPEFIAEILRMAPVSPEIARNRTQLHDQFIYRCNYSPEHQVLYAVVQFGDQFIFQLIAVGREMDAKLCEMNAEQIPSSRARHECFLMDRQR